MVVSGLVIALDEGEQAEALRTLAAAGPFTLGERFGRRLAAVLEAEDAESSRRWHEWAEGLPGVACIEVAFAGFGKEGEA